MVSMLQQVFTLGLGLAQGLAHQVNQLFSCSTGTCFMTEIPPSAIFIQCAALWGRIVSSTESLLDSGDEAVHQVLFETYLFPAHASTILARGKYPVLRKRRVILCLSDEQYGSIIAYLNPIQSPLMRIEVQERLSNGSKGLGLAVEKFYVKARSMIALTAFF